MHLATLILLLLGPCSAVPLDNDHEDDTGAYRNVADTNHLYGERYPGGLINYRAYINTNQRHDDRHKRALSPFLQAFKAILKTTFGYRRMKVLGTERKMFAKVGTYDDAVADFHSLGATNIVPEKYGLRGQVGNQVIELHTRLSVGSRIPRAILYVIDDVDAMAAYGVPSTTKIAREIYYFENRADTKTLGMGFFPWR